jgi:methionyl-tRNA formyltransferase
MRPTPVKAKALELGLPVFQPDRLSAPGEFEKLQALRPDAIVVVAYGQILKQNVLDLPRLGCINIHSSLLPRWRGAAPIQWAILGGDDESGVTTMKLVQKLDAGDILLQAKTKISFDDTAESLHDRLARMGAELIGPTLRGLAEGSLRARPQDESKVTLASKLSKEMERLDGAETAVQLDRRVRALNPWPGTSIMVDGQRLKIKKARPMLKVTGKPGLLFERVGMLLLGTAEGSLELLRLQWEGKKEVDAAGFLNGLKGRGQILPVETK